jgi:hypothetical protein
MYLQASHTCLIHHTPTHSQEDYLPFFDLQGAERTFYKKKLLAVNKFNRCTVPLL